MSNLPTLRPPSRYENAKKLTPIMPAELISEIKSPSRVKFERQRNSQFILSQYMKRKEDMAQLNNPAPNKTPSRSSNNLQPEAKKPPLPKSSQGRRVNKGSMFCTDIWPDKHFKQFIKQGEEKVTRESNQIFIKERTRAVDHYRRDLDKMFVKKHPEYALGNEICRSYIEGSDGEGANMSRDQSANASMIINSFFKKPKASSQTLISDERPKSMQFTRPSLPRLSNKSSRVGSVSKIERPNEETNEACDKSFECSIADGLEDRSEDSEFLSTKKKGNSMASTGFNLDFSSIFNPDGTNLGQGKNSLSSRQLSVGEFDQPQLSSRSSRDDRSLLERSIRDPFKIQKVIFVNKKGVKRKMQYWQPKSHMRKNFHGDYESSLMNAALITRGRDRRSEYGLL